MVKNDDSNMPPEQRIPPMTVVWRNPILSTSTPDTMERKNVAPIVSEPTRAGMEKKL